MAENLNQLYWGEGVAFADGQELFDIQELTINFGLKGLNYSKGDGGSDVFIPTGQPITGRAGFLGLNAALLATLTGGASATGTKKRIRSEALVVATDAVTTSQTPITNTLRVVESGSNKVPLKQVASSPSAGEYTVSGTTITFNATQFADAVVINVSYLYAAAGAGESVTIDPSDLPSNFELYCTLRTREQFGQTSGDIVAYFSSVDRTGEFSMGGSIGNVSTPGFDFNVNNNVSGDVVISFP